ncbi:MAG: hypothetical protein AAF485_28850 [Chloroflexota bacterium]
MKKSFDVLILFGLVIARIRIDTLADNVLPQRHEHVRQLVEGWWPGWSLDLLAHPETDPVSILLIVTAIGLLFLYLLIDISAEDLREVWTHRLKLALVYGIIGLLVVAKTFLLINLRHQQGPASYAHDGGVIQTEVTIDYFLNGLNPYVEDYVDTPMAEWGFSKYRTALYHYPYLPWTFIFSTPFYLVSQASLGWFDTRMVYLLLFVLTLVGVQQLVRERQAQLIALAVVGLNPLASLSLVFGENDPFVFAWIIFGLWSLQTTWLRSDTHRVWLGSLFFGLACASKPTAWFIIPFFAFYLLRDQWGANLIPPVGRWITLFRTLGQRAWPLPVAALLIIGPWFVWNPDAMYDDVWRWSAGIGPTGYQIWGWGASNYVLAFGWVADRFDYWPFIIPGAILSIPVFLLLLRRQLRTNTVEMMLYSYAIFLLAFFFVSRFLQPNYLGYMLGFLALAVTINSEKEIDYVE